MHKVMFSLASTLTLLAATALLPVHAEVIETTTETVNPAPIAAPKVLDSWMQPSVTRSKTVTSSDGTTEKTVEPLIMERHETVAVPTEEKVTTTTRVAPASVTEVITTPAVTSTVKRHAVRHVSHKAPRHRHVAVHRSAAPTTVSKTVVVQPEVITQKQVIEQKSVVMERPDPALNQP